LRVPVDFEDRCGGGGGRWGLTDGVGLRLRAPRRPSGAEFILQHGEELLRTLDELDDGDDFACGKRVPASTLHKRRNNTRTDAPLARFSVEIFIAPFLVPCTSHVADFMESAARVQPSSPVVVVVVPVLKF
jgi:hypothetical protein